MVLVHFTLPVLSRSLSFIPTGSFNCIYFAAASLMMIDWEESVANTFEKSRPAVTSHPTAFPNPADTPQPANLESSAGFFPGQSYPPVLFHIAVSGPVEFP